MRAAQLIGNPAAFRVRSLAADVIVVPESKLLALPDYPGSPLFSPAERDILAFTEQFLMDVGGTDATVRAGLIEHFGADSARELVSAIYVVEFTQRLQLIAARVLDDDASSPALVSPPPVGDASPADLLNEYQAAVIRGSTLDPMTTELIRLRCARTHQCRICQTLRLADALAAGVDEEITAQIDFYERSDLPDRAKVALRVTDAFITRPDLLSDTAGGAGPDVVRAGRTGLALPRHHEMEYAEDPRGAGHRRRRRAGDRRQWCRPARFDETGRPTGYRRR